VWDLKAEVNARGKSDTLVRALQGKVDIRAKDGAFIGSLCWRKFFRSECDGTPAGKVPNLNGGEFRL